MLSPLTPTQFVAMLAAGALLALMAAIFARLDRAAQRLAELRHDRQRRARFRDDSFPR